MNLSEIRTEIDKTDKELVRLLERRFELVGQVAVQKALSGTAVYNRAREEEVINSVNSLVKNRDYADYIVDTFCGIMDISKQYQNHYLLNLVLIGMPGCGKTTVGRAFAEKYGYTFIDADEEFLKQNGMSASECINKYGEAKFRELETKVLESFRPNTRCVYALGGGVVTVADNFELVKPLGLVIYLTRELSELATGDRPITASKGLEEIYRERADRYDLWADAAVPNTSVQNAVEQIAKMM